MLSTTWTVTDIIILNFHSSTYLLRKKAWFSLCDGAMEFGFGLTLSSSWFLCRAVFNLTDDCRVVASNAYLAMALPPARINLITTNQSRWINHLRANYFWQELVQVQITGLLRWSQSFNLRLLVVISNSLSTRRFTEWGLPNQSV